VGSNKTGRNGRGESNVKQTLKKHIPSGLLMAALAVLALAVACTSAASEPDADAPDGAAPNQHAIPATATMIGRVDLAAILADDAVADLLGALPSDGETPSSLEDALAMVQGETGIDPAQVTDIVLFATGSDEDGLGLILSGTLVLDELVAAVEGAQGKTATVEDVFGTDVYTFAPGASGEDDDFSLAALSDGRVVAGGTGAVRASVTVDAGEAQAVSGELVDRLDALGTPWLSLVADVTASDVGKLMGPDGMLGDDGPLGAFGGELPIDLSAFADVRTLSLALDRAGNDFIANAEIGFGTADGATRAAAMIDGFTSLFKAFVPDPTLLSFLDGLDVAATGADLSVDFTIATGEATKLVGNLLNIASQEIEFSLPDFQ